MISFNKTSYLNTGSVGNLRALLEPTLRHEQAGCLGSQERGLALMRRCLTPTLTFTDIAYNDSVTAWRERNHIFYLMHFLPNEKDFNSGSG